jgi:hypothetical protein
VSLIQESLAMPKNQKVKTKVSKNHLYTGQEILNRQNEAEAEAEKKQELKEQKKKELEKKKEASKLKKQEAEAAKRKREEEKAKKQHPPPKKKKLNNKQPSFVQQQPREKGQKKCKECLKLFNPNSQGKKIGVCCCCCGKLWYCSNCWSSNLNGVQLKFHQHEIDCENK